MSMAFRPARECSGYVQPTHLETPVTQIQSTLSIVILTLTRFPIRNFVFSYYSCVVPLHLSLSFGQTSILRVFSFRFARTCYHYTIPI